MRYFLAFGVLFFGLYACKNPSKALVAPASMAPPTANLSSTGESTMLNATPVTINLDGRMELEFQVSDIWTDDAYLHQIHRDTVFLMLGLVERISGHHFSIKLLDTSIQQVSVYQQYETSLTIMDEGPHVDLTDWLHYTSDWQELPVNNLRFSSVIYDSQDYQQFPEVSNEDLVKAVSDRVSDHQRWVELARRCPNPQSYPCGVAISRYLLKFTLQDIDDKVSEQVIVFEVPMGC